MENKVGRGNSQERINMGEEEWEKYQINRKREKAKEYYKRRKRERNRGEEGGLIFMGRKIKNIRGLRSGLLVAIKPVGKINNEKYVCWECECDCGNKKNVRCSHIVTGHTKSCGCQGRGKGSNSYVSMDIKDYGEIPAWYYKVILKGAKRRNIYVGIDIKYINDLFVAQNKKCSLSGIDIRFYDKFNKTKTTASLDRIDSNKGYISGNLQWVHKDFNRMKLTFDQKYFFELCKKIVDFNGL